MKAVYLSYIDAPFLKNHRSRKPKETSADYDSPEMKNWKAINEFLYCGTKVVLFKKGVDSTDLQEGNPIAFALLSAYWERSRNDIELIEELNESMLDNNNALSIFLFTDAVRLGFSPAALGLIKYDSKTVQKHWLDNPSKAKEYLISGAQLVNNQLKSWSDFKRFGFSTNAIVIMDNYIFSNRKNIATNFLPLIDTLYPGSLSKVPLDILVVTKFFYGSTGTRPKKESEALCLEEVFDYVSDKLKTCLKQRAFHLTIVQKTTELDKSHDRNIITNYLRIKISNSLSFFDANGKARMASDVTLDPLPHIRRNGDETYGDNTLVFLKRAADVLSDNMNKRHGVGTHRLLRFFYKVF